MHVSMDVEVVGAQVSLDEQLVLSRVTTSKHKHATARHKPVELFKPHALWHLFLECCDGLLDVGAVLASLPATALALLFLLTCHKR